jgi:hypothetical protein
MATGTDTKPIVDYQGPTRRPRSSFWFVFATIVGIVALVLTLLGCTGFLWLIAALHN